MSKAAEYRGIASKFRREAAQASLPQQRQLALSAADRWDLLAQEMEATIAPSVALARKRPGWHF